MNLRKSQPCAGFSRFTALLFISASYLTETVSSDLSDWPYANPVALFTLEDAGGEASAKRGIS
jgi:hypothetical protein